LKKILFLAHHRIDRSPGQRYRFEQFFDYLELKGIQCFLANIINEKDEIALYHSKSILKKIKIVIKEDGFIQVKFINMI
jgi:hypothetical protein